ncbi:putative ankyrin repeat protein [Glarea lozoyensis 74030]|uniref:Putative ankyrin repeat protein n=1 Tax=Glarea lozoyensis (strain ATCC 74030 / MF5533) TaxID=1104152 RepID=H0EVV4_GLAL7|nr:putative ankyrin repeat protein [Glarea lozoyensis 74030]
MGLIFAVAEILNCPTGPRKYPYGGYSLQIAIRKSHEEIAKLLIEKGANIKAQGWDGSTAISTAVIKGHTAIVELLLDLGEDVNARDRNGTSLIQHAAQHRGGRSKI